MFVRARFQYGSLRLRKRERSTDVWEFRYYETSPGWQTDQAKRHPWGSSALPDRSRRTEGNASSSHAAQRRSSTR